MRYAAREARLRPVLAIVGRTNEPGVRKVHDAPTAETRIGPRGACEAQWIVGEQGTVKSNSFNEESASSL